MPKKTTTRPKTTDLSPVERRRKIELSKTPKYTTLSVDTFKRHYGHLIKKISPRRCAVELGDLIDLPPPPKD